MFDWLLLNNGAGPFANPTVSNVDRHLPQPGGGGGGRRQRTSQQIAGGTGQAIRQSSRRGARPGALDTTLGVGTQGLDPRMGRGGPSPSPLLVNPPTATGAGRRMSAGMGVHPYSNINAAASPGGQAQGYNGSAGNINGPGHARGMTGEDTLGYPSQGRSSAMGYNARGYGSNVAVRGLNGPGGPMGSGIINGHGGPHGMGPVPEERERKGILAVLCCR